MRQKRLIVVVLERPEARQLPYDDNDRLGVWFDCPCRDQVVNDGVDVVKQLAFAFAKAANLR